MRRAQIDVKVLCLAACGLMSGALIIIPDIVQAGFFHDLSRAARSFGNIPGGGSRPGHRPSGNSGSSGSSDDDSSSSSSSPTTLASALKDAKNAAAAVAEWQEMDRAKRLELGRNVDLALTAFLNKLREYHRSILRAGVNVDAATGLNINQVTAGELRKGADDAYKQAHLYEFERYSGELWTRDRLMVRIIQQAQGGLQPYFEGVGARGPSMAEINDLFAKSAIAVHSQALEISEVVGVSLSFDRFIRAMYENSDRTEGLWARGSNEQADALYERLATALIDTVPRERFIQDGAGLASDPLGLERQFQYRFRARRALYDCLTAHYQDFVAGPSSGKPIDASFTGKPELQASADPGVATKGFVPEPTHVSTNDGKPSAPAVQTANSSAGPRDATVVTVSSGVRDKAQSYIAQFCRDSTLSVAALAREGKIEPISTRIDASVPSSDGSDPGAGQASGVLLPQ